MKLSSLYSSHPHIFERIDFNQNMNIVLAEVRRPENKQKSSHSLGKSLLVTLIDYCLLKTVDKSYFLNRQYETFEDFSFFLEVEVSDSDYFTIKRSVKKRSKIQVKRHQSGMQSFTYLPDANWDSNAGLAKSKEYINELLSFDVLPNRNYRSSLGYFLRDNNSFGDVFKLSKFVGGRDIDWKPLVAELLGYESNRMQLKYKLDNQVLTLKAQYKELVQNEQELHKQEERYRTVIALKEAELRRKEKEYDSFNFSTADVDKPDMLATEIDKVIAQLMKENYYFKSQIQQATKSIVKFKFDLGELESFYTEIGVYFKEQLKKDYQELVQFNEEIVGERNGILQEMINEYTVKLNDNTRRIGELNEKRSKALAYINATETFEKFKLLQNEIVKLRADVEVLNGELNNLHDARDVDIMKQRLESELSQVIADLKESFFNSDNKAIAEIKKHFTDIIVKTLGDVGLISISLNGNNNIEFEAEIIDRDTQAKSSKDKGSTYRKLMCCAFDLSVAATYSDNKYFHFVFHDSVFDGLDDRQKENLLTLVTDYSEKYDIQYIFSSIQDELPPAIRSPKELKRLKNSRTVVKLLHDEGPDGRLFKMEAF